MKIDNLTDLKTLIKMCHKEGIKSIEVDGVKLLLGDVPVSPRRLKSEQPEIKDEIPAYTDEELMTWSANG